MAFGNADAYARFMGRFSEPLSPLFADLVDVPPEGRVVDVGCGPGVLTAELVERYGAERVDAIDPSPPFVDAARARLPGVDVRQGSAEALPYPDDSYSAALAQLVVHFMADPVAGLREMSRVTRPGATVAACVWDHHGGRGPLTPFWSAAERLDPGLGGEKAAAGSRKGHLVELFEQAGIADVEGGELSVTTTLPTFEDWWAPYEEPAGSVGDYLASRSPEQVAELRELCRSRLPSGSFGLTSVAWFARGTVSSANATRTSR